MRRRKKKLNRNFSGKLKTESEEPRGRYRKEFRREKGRLREPERNKR